MSLTDVPTPGQVRRSRTAEIVCALRAAESRRPVDQRLIDDPYAHHFLDSTAYRALCGTRPTAAAARTVFDRIYPGYLAIVLLRNRCSEQLLTATQAEGIRQVVLLGAGFDSTALRVPLPDAAVFEVDAPPTQQVKRRVLEKLGARPATRYVGCDFERDSLPDRLLEAGFDPSRRAVFLWWGVSFFLTEPAVRSTLSDVAMLSAQGSRFAFDYVDDTVVDGTTTYAGARRAVAAVQRRGEPYRFGVSRPGAAALVDSYGYDVVDNLSIPDLAERFTPAWPYRTDDFFSVLTGRRR